MANQELFSKGLAVTQLAFSFLIVGLEVMKNHELRNVYLSFIQVLPPALGGQHRTPSPCLVGALQFTSVDFSQGGSMVSAPLIVFRTPFPPPLVPRVEGFVPADLLISRGRHKCGGIDWL